MNSVPTPQISVYGSRADDKGRTVVSDTAPLLCGTASAGSDVSIFIDDVKVGDAIADMSGAWTYQVTAALAGGQHDIQSSTTATLQGSATELTVLTTAQSTTHPYLLVPDPSEDGPRMSFAKAAMSTDQLEFYPARPNLPGGTDNWFIVEWLHKDVIDPNNFVLDNSAVSDPTLGHPYVTFNTDDAGEQLNVYQDAVSGQYIYDIRQNGGHFSGAGPNILLQAVVSDWADQTFDKDISFSVDVKVSEADIAVAPGMYGSALSAMEGFGFILDFNAPTASYYDPSLPTYHVMFQIPITQTWAIAEFLYPQSYGLHLGAGASETQNVAGEVLDGSPQLALQADGGALQHWDFDLNEYLSALLSQSSYTDASGAVSSLPAEYLDFSRWAIEGVYLGPETMTDYPANGKQMISGTASIGMTFANFQLTRDPTVGRAYQYVSAGGHDADVYVPSTDTGVPTPLAGSGPTPDTPAITAAAQIEEQVSVSGSGDPGDLLVLFNSSTVAATTTIGDDGTWSAQFAGTLASGNLTAVAYDSYGGKSAASAAYAVTGTQLATSGTSSGASSGTSSGAGSTDTNADGGGDQSATSPFLVVDKAGPVTVPGGVSMVLVTVSGSEIYGNDASGQTILSTKGFTFFAGGGSGTILADDAHAGGKAGDNQIVVPASGGTFQIQTGSGNDTVDVSAGNVTVSPGGGANLIFLGSGTNLVQCGGNDTVISGSGDVTVGTSAGAEALIFGGNGSLTFTGGDGAATVVAGAGHAEMSAGSGSVVFWGSRSGGSIMRAGSGAATIAGGGGGNQIYANGSSDLLLVAGQSNSTLVGGTATGHNVYWGSPGADLIQADAGDDTICGGSGQDTIECGSGSDTVFASGTGETVLGGTGTATIVFGGQGQSTLSFVKGTAGGTDFVWGFQPGTDRLVVSGYGADELQQAMSGAKGFGNGSLVQLSDGTNIVFGDVSDLRPMLSG